MGDVFKVNLLKKPQQKISEEERKNNLEMPEGIRDEGFMGVHYIGGLGHQLKNPNFQVLLKRTLPGYEK